MARLTDADRHTVTRMPQLHNTEMLRYKQGQHHTLPQPCNTDTHTHRNNW